MLTGRVLIPPAFVSAGAATGTLSAIAKPASVAIGDTLYLLMADQAPGATFTPPAGFSLVGSVSTNLKLSVYRRTVDGSEGATFSASVSGSTFPAAVCVAYRNLATVERTTSTFNAASGTTQTYSSIGSIAGDAVIGFGAAVANVTSSTPAGHVERVDTTVTGFGTIEFQVVDILASAGADGSVNATLSGSAAHATIRVANAPL